MKALIIVVCVAVWTGAAWADGGGHPRFIGTSEFAFGKGEEMVKVQLAGIDAPDWEQKCKRADGWEYACGQLAFAVLKAKIGTQDVWCEDHGRNSNGYRLSVCWLLRDSGKHVNLNQWMVLEGWAVVYPKYFRHRSLFVEEEKEAREAKRGLWQGEFEKPWEWRKRNRHKK